LILHKRHNFVNSPPRHHACSFALCTFYFLDKSSQTKEIFDSEKCPPCRDADKWILRPDVRPIKRYGRFAPLRVEKENTTLTWQSPYTFYLKLDISVWMKWMNDPEGFVVKILLGCS